MKQTIPIFFSVNDAYAPFLAVALNSVKSNASEKYNYKVHILNDDISEENRIRLQTLESDNFALEFISLTEKLHTLFPDGRLEQHSFGAFSSLTIYFRLFIPALFPQYDKGIYLDSDIVVPGDISQLWEERLGRNLVGACADHSIQHIAPFTRYIDRYVGVDHRRYVNSGVLLLNMKRLREVDMAGRFLHWMSTYSLDTVAPDQDYLNALCWNAIHYLDPAWNTMPLEKKASDRAPMVVHFNLATKPWLNRSVPFDDIFWRYALSSGYNSEIRATRKAFLKDDSALQNYNSGVESLLKMASSLAESGMSFRSLISERKEFRLCC